MLPLSAALGSRKPCSLHVSRAPEHLTRHSHYSAACIRWASHTDRSCKACSKALGIRFLLRCLARAANLEHLRTMLPMIIDGRRLLHKSEGDGAARQDLAFLQPYMVRQGCYCYLLQTSPNRVQLKAVQESHTAQTLLSKLA